MVSSVAQGALTEAMPAAVSLLALVTDTTPSGRSTGTALGVTHKAGTAVKAVVEWVDG